MKDISELNPHQYKTNPNIEKNLKTLFRRLIQLQDAFTDSEPGSFEFVINSGLRSDEKQQALIAAGKTNAVHSKHLAGAAADVNDPAGTLANYVKANIKFLEVIGLWVEHPDYTDGWVHFQVMAPGSGRRIFIP